MEYHPRPYLMSEILPLIPQALNHGGMTAARAVLFCINVGFKEGSKSGCKCRGYAAPLKLLQLPGPFGTLVGGGVVCVSRAWLRSGSDYQALSFCNVFPDPGGKSGEITGSILDDSRITTFISSGTLIRMSSHEMIYQALSTRSTFTLSERLP